MAVQPSVQELTELMSNPSRVRNLCVLAHVDHGKTSMTDSLISSNGIISARLAGKLRYLDTREDEQLRCITMKSSSISLRYTPNAPILPTTCKEEVAAEAHLINVIDSPGHVDFCSEVASALRLCDGALVLVDVVEGVRTQTMAVLRQAWEEHVTPCLILNKIDRLIVELQMTPLDAYRHLKRIIENVNAVCASFYQEQFSKAIEERDLDADDDATLDMIKEKMEKEGTLRPAFEFSPALGNVSFASATGSWAFRVDIFAQLVAVRTGMKVEGLAKAIWPEDGTECFFNPKTKALTRKDEGRLKPMFVQFILEQIWAVYSTVMLDQDDEKAQKIVASLKLNVTAKELGNKNREEALRSVMSKWLPLSDAVLAMTVQQLPPPTKAQATRMDRLMPRDVPAPEHLQAGLVEMEGAFRTCSPSSKEALAFVSKMFANDSEGSAGVDTKFIAFSRVFAGTLKVGDEVHVMGPRYDPAQPDSVHVSTAKVGSLHLMMGRDLMNVNEVPAGCVCGIGGLDRHILKYATLSSTKACRPLSFMAFQALPIVRVAVEPENPTHHEQLVKGLQLLNQADPSVETRVQETGELIIVASGEMHLERCIKDLEELFAQTKLRVSPPLVQFKETLARPTLPDGTVINPPISATAAAALGMHVTTATTANKVMEIDIRAIPLPGKVRKALIAHHEELKAGQQRWRAGEPLLPATAASLNALKERMKDVGGDWKEVWGKIWALGPKGIGPNLLINGTQDFAQTPDWLPPRVHGECWQLAACT